MGDDLCGVHICRCICCQIYCCLYTFPSASRAVRILVSNHQDMRSSRIPSNSSFLNGKLRSSVPSASLWLVMIWWSWNLFQSQSVNGSDERIGGEGLTP